MDPRSLRITIELPQGADVQTSGGAMGGIVGGAGQSATPGAIDAGPPPAALVAALGDAATPFASPVETSTTFGGPSGEAIDAGSFPAQLAAEMEAEGPRHPFGHPDSGMATALSPVLDRESRN